METATEPTNDLAELPDNEPGTAYPNLTLTGTYSVEDNKLRLSASSRLPKELYERVKAAGFQWAPKQEIFVAPSWTPAREDLLLELCGEVDDEGYSATERAADRAERFGNYRDKRRTEAGGHADRFESGPTAFGHQSRARAERQAARHDRHRGRAVSQWSKAEYWQSRTEGVIANALYKESPAVRRSRILRLEAEQRKHEGGREDYAARFAAWSKVATLDGAGEPIPQEIYHPWENKPEVTSTRPAPTTPAGRLAYLLANTSGCYGEYRHPRNPDRKNSLFGLITDEADPITPAEAAALWLDGTTDPADPDSYSARWSAHYVNRLAYERAMLANEGGSVSDADMEPGGWIRTRNRTGSVFTNVAEGWKQIHAVTRSPKTKRVTSVKVMGMVGCRDPKPGLVSVNIERLGEDAYRAPTDAERAEFATATKERKAKAKAEKPVTGALINPTDADAEKLQAIWNAEAKASHEKGKRYGTFNPSAVWRMTQAEYSARSKGDYGPCETSDVSERLEIRGKYYSSRGNGGRVTVFKVRTGSAGGSSWHVARRVVVLTDKPQKPIPWVEVDLARSMQPTPTAVRERMGFLASVISAAWTPEDGTPEAKILDDARYVGWASVESRSQFHFTDEGKREYAEWRARQEATGVNLANVRYTANGEYHKAAAVAAAR